MTRHPTTGNGAAAQQSERPPRSPRDLTPLERFYTHVNKMGPVAKNAPHLGRCHIWTGGTDPKGYGIFWADGTTHRAHIWIYKTKVGPVPAGRELDHFACDRYGCVNELHTRPVTHRENVLRSGGGGAINAAKEMCPKRHLFNEANTRVNGKGSRECLACKRDAQKQMKQAMRALERGYTPLPAGSSACPEGHDLTGDGASYTYHGHLVCLTCTAPRGRGRRELLPRAAPAAS